MAYNVDILILDHHLMRDQQGLKWLDALSAEAGKQVYCAADFMVRKRLLLEAGRIKLYETMPEPTSWYEDYAEGVISADE